MKKLQLPQLLKGIKLLLIIVGIVLLPLPFLVGNLYWVHVLVMCLYYTAVAQTWNWVCGYMGQFSLAHAGLLTVGGYTSGLLAYWLGVPPLIGMIAGGLAAAGLGFVLAGVSLRLKGSYFVVVTIGLSEVVRITIINMWDYTRGTAGLRVPPLMGVEMPTYGYYYLMLFFMLILMFLTYKLVNSSLGLATKAIREDEDVAMVMGIRNIRTKLLIFCGSSFFAGMLGASYVHYLRVAGPEMGSLFEMFYIMAMALIGGRGTLFGPIIGAFIIEFFSEYLRELGFVIRMIVLGLVIIAVARFLPEGVWSLINKVLKSRKIALEA